MKARREQSRGGSAQRGHDSTRRLAGWPAFSPQHAPSRVHTLVPHSLPLPRAVPLAIAAPPAPPTLAVLLAPITWPSPACRYAPSSPSSPSSFASPSLLHLALSSPPRVVPVRPHCVRTCCVAVPLLHAAPPPSRVPAAPFTPCRAPTPCRTPSPQPSPSEPLPLWPARSRAAPAPRLRAVWQPHWACRRCACPSNEEARPLAAPPTIPSSAPLVVALCYVSARAPSAALSTASAALSTTSAAFTHCTHAPRAVRVLPALSAASSRPPPPSPPLLAPYAPSSGRPSPSRLLCRLLRRLLRRLRRLPALYTPLTRRTRHVFTPALLSLRRAALSQPPRHRLALRYTVLRRLVHCLAVSRVMPRPPRRLASHRAVSHPSGAAARLPSRCLPAAAPVPLHRARWRRLAARKHTLALPPSTPTLLSRTTPTSRAVGWSDAPHHWSHPAVVITSAAVTPVTSAAAIRKVAAPAASREPRVGHLAHAAPAPIRGPRSCHAGRVHCPPLCSRPMPATRQHPPPASVSVRAVPRPLHNRPAPVAPVPVAPVPVVSRPPAPATAHPVPAHAHARLLCPCAPCAPPPFAPVALYTP
ncbi:hypothetical protein DENSPDRAFT_886254 [Dentipellis sp. KUC8613]|nr:hypothetical protein DENSPDRAFT_886254 [Dentipellis sp. KUC8613]